MYRFRFSFFYLALAVSIIVHSCGRPPEIPIHIDRLEQSLFTLPVDSIAASIPRLEQQYGELLELYSRRVIRIGSPKNPDFSNELSRFLTDADMNLAYKRVMEVFPDVKDIETGLGQAFYNYGVEFPDRVIPSVYTLISGFNESIVIADTILAIALDKYLGANDEFYFMLDLPNYLRKLMDRKYIVADCMKFWLTTEFPYNDSIDNVLANILYEGKIMYALHHLLPATPDSLLFGFSPSEMRWCRNNTSQMWTYLVENRLLFATDYMTISKLVGPAPFTSLFTRESPGRAVIWLGYRMIASYMKNDRQSLESLLAENDYQKILTRAKFKP